MSEQYEYQLPDVTQQPDSKVVPITPALAKVWLGHNIRNRSLRVDYVNDLAGRIERGEWEMTGEAIKFSVNGALLDGQHRLSAIVKSGVTVPMMVMRGIAESAQDHMDTNRARTAADMLGLHGYANTSTLAAAARLALGVESGSSDPGKNPVTHAKVKRFVEENPSMIDSVEFTRGLARKTDCPPSVVAYTHWRLSQIDAIEASNFWFSAAEKIGLSAGDPVIALTNRFAESRRNREQLSKRVYLSLIYRAWNARRVGKTLTMIRVNSPKGGLVPVPDPI